MSRPSMIALMLNALGAAMLFVGAYADILFLQLLGALIFVAGIYADSTLIQSATKKD